MAKNRRKLYNIIQNFPQQGKIVQYYTLYNSPCFGGILFNFIQFSSVLAVFLLVLDRFSINFQQFLCNEKPPTS